MWTIKWGIVAFLMQLPVYAADIPTDVIGSDNFDKKMCIDQYTQQCLDSVCMTSSALDCSDQCKAEAEDKCAEEENEQ